MTLALALCATSASPIGPVTFHESEFSRGAPIHGVVLTTLAGRPIPALSFTFHTDGLPSKEAGLRGGPGDTSFVQDPGIEGPTGGALTIDFGADVDRTSFGIALSGRTAVARAGTVALLDHEGDVVDTRPMAAKPSDQRFVGNWIHIDGTIPFRAIRLRFNPQASPRFLFDNLEYRLADGGGGPSGGGGAGPSGFPGGEGGGEDGENPEGSDPDEDLITDLGSSPNIARLGDELLVAWSSPTADGRRIFLQHFDSEFSPLSPPRQVNETAGRHTAPRIVRLGERHFAVAWEVGAAGDETTVLARWFDTGVSPVSDPVKITSHGRCGFAALGAPTTEDPRASLFLVSRDCRTLVARRYDASGELLGSALELDTPGRVARPSAARHADGRISISWIQHAPSAQCCVSFLMTRTFDAELRSLGAVSQVNDDSGVDLLEAAALPTRGGGAVTVWQEGASAGSAPAIRGQRLRYDGTPAGGDFPLAPGAVGQQKGLSVATAPDGTAAVLWRQEPSPLAAAGEAPSASGLYARYLSPSGALLAPQLLIEKIDGVAVESAVAAFDGSAIRAVLATGPETADGPLVRRSFETPALGPPSSCADGDRHALCLRDERFRLQATWTDRRGITHRATPGELSDDTGYFWFFGSQNLEIVVKVLDGRAINRHHWVFFASLTNVAFALEVVDTWTGDRKVYESPAGRLASVGDTEALPDYSAVDSTAALRAGAGREPSSGSELRDPAWIRGQTSAAQCSDDALCLADDRFEVTVRWFGSEGETGQGSPAALTPETGIFWFFEPENVEAVVKILDARDINGHFWIFLGSLSNVEYEVSVLDHQTGARRSYVNPRGVFSSLSDTSAFSDP